MTNETVKTDSKVTKKQIFFKICISILLLGGLSFLFSQYPKAEGTSWYHQLNQPVFAPPYWLPFAMWTLVYVLCGSAFGIIWHYAAKNQDNVRKKAAKLGLILFGIHLIFNLIFPVILIGLQRPVVSFIDIMILIVFIILLIRQFKKVSQTASNLLIPYLIWIIYAASLNASILILN